MPTRRNGNVSNHTNGYSTRASSASGQHRMNRMHQRKKAAMATSPAVTVLRSTFIAGGAAPHHHILRWRTPGSSVHRIVLEPQALGDGCGHFRIESHVRVVHFGVKDASKRMDKRQGAPFCQRQPDRKRYERISRHLGVNAPQQFIYALTGKAGDEYGCACSAAVPCRAIRKSVSLLWRQPVDLVEHVQSGAASNAKLLQYFFDFFIEFIVVRVRDVAHVKN